MQTSEERFLETSYSCDDVCGERVYGICINTCVGMHACMWVYVTLVFFLCLTPLVVDEWWCGLCVCLDPHTVE